MASTDNRPFNPSLRRNEESNYSNPLAALENVTANGGVISQHQFYPSDLGIYGKYLSFYAYKYRKPSKAAESRALESTPAAKISLPLPVNLVNTYKQNYDTAVQLGALGGLISDSLSGTDANRIQQIVSRAMNNGAATSISDLAGSVGQNIGAITQGMGQGLAALTADALLTRNDPQRGGVIGAIGVTLGVARNPNLAVLFTSSDLRTFSFEFKMIAKNKKELASIQSICHAFKKLSAPSRFDLNASNAGYLNDNLLFQYPYMWQMQFSEDIENSLWKFAPAVCTNVSINPHGEGQPYYFVEGGKKHPAVVSLSLEFTEITILTQEDIAKGY